jgi:hypothetical protein
LNLQSNLRGRFLHKQTDRAGALRAIQRAANFSTGNGAESFERYAKYLVREPVPELPGRMERASKIFGVLVGQIFGFLLLRVFVLGVIVFTAGHAFFEIADRFAESATDLRQLARTENNQRDHQYHHEFRHTESKHVSS